MIRFPKNDNGKIDCDATTETSAKSYCIEKPENDMFSIKNKIINNYQEKD